MYHSHHHVPQHQLWSATSSIILGEVLDETEPRPVHEGEGGVRGADTPYPHETSGPFFQR